MVWKIFRKKLKGSDSAQRTHNAIFIVYLALTIEVISCPLAAGKSHCDLGEITCSSLVGSPGPSAAALTVKQGDPIITSPEVPSTAAAGNSWLRWMLGDQHRSGQQQQQDEPSDDPTPEVCIQVEWVCDGHPDCPDEEDESFCQEVEPSGTESSAVSSLGGDLSDRRQK
jgi:hypothetical protein